MPVPWSQGVVSYRGQRGQNGSALGRSCQHEGRVRHNGKSNMAVESAGGAVRFSFSICSLQMSMVKLAQSRSLVCCWLAACSSFTWFLSWPLSILIQSVLALSQSATTFHSRAVRRTSDAIEAGGVAAAGDSARRSSSCCCNRSLSCFSPATRLCRPRVVSRSVV